MKYRIVEYADWHFEVEEKHMFRWRPACNYIGDGRALRSYPIHFTSRPKAEQYIDTEIAYNKSLANANRVLSKTIYPPNK